MSGSAGSASGNGEGSSGLSVGRRVRQPYDFEDEWEDENDDDMDFEDVEDEVEDEEENDEGDDMDDSGDYHDAAEHLRLEFLDDDEEEEGDGEETGRNEAAGPATAATRTGLSRRQIMQVLVQSNLARILGERLPSRRTRAQQRVDDGDSDDSEGAYGVFGRRRKKNRASYPAVPSKEGQELMNSGGFGDHEPDKRRNARGSSKLVARLFERELGIEGAMRARIQNRLMAQTMIPSSIADTIIHYDARCYSGQFSDDGAFFFSCAQDFKVRLYDTSNPYKWKYYKTVTYPGGQWTITDASLSPDNKFLAYSSIQPFVYLAPTDPADPGEPYVLDFSNRGAAPGRSTYFSYAGFGIWSIRFSGDGREIVAGTQDHSIYVYDLETRKSILKIHGHEDDVNAVCFGDKSSPHILYSGSDDTTLKVWDRRSLNDKRAAGVFLGHSEGLTYVDSKGDGRYILSNGKDQTMKLWDLRKMMSTEKADKIDPSRYSTGFDYRYMTFDEDTFKPHPHDCSVVTFRGHKVLKTLIRCHFSPQDSTNGRYVYSGSWDGRIHVYNLDATIAGIVDVNKGTEPSPYPGREGYSSSSWKTCVRDASWHPNAPMIAATSWNGWDMAEGTCSTHIWDDGTEGQKGDPKASVRVNEKLQHDDRLYESPEADLGLYIRRRRRAR